VHRSHHRHRKLGRHPCMPVVPIADNPGRRLADRKLGRKPGRKRRRRRRWDSHVHSGHIVGSDCKDHQRRTSAAVEHIQLAEHHVAVDSIEILYRVCMYVSKRTKRSFSFPVFLLT
jgi:hypothetical protein